MQNKSYEISDLDILKIIFTDPVWLKEFQSQENSFVDLVAAKLDKKDKQHFRVLVNSAMKQAADDVVTNYNLDKQGENQWIIDLLLPKKGGKRGLGTGLWSQALSWFSWVSPRLPRNKETDRNIDRLFAMLYAGMHTFGRDVDNFKKVLIRGQDGSDKLLDVTTLQLPQNIGLKKSMEYPHGHFFDDAIFAAFFFDLQEDVDSLKEINGSMKQCNFTSGISFVNKKGASANFQDASKPTYLLESLRDKGIEEQDILIQMLNKAKERLATLNKAQFGYENVVDKELRKSTWQKLDKLYSADVCNTLYESRRLGNPWAAEELSELLEKSCKDLDSAQQLVIQKESTVLEIKDKLLTFLTSFDENYASTIERYELNDDIKDKITAKIAGLKSEQEETIIKLNKKRISFVANYAPIGKRKSALDKLDSIVELERNFDEFKGNFDLHQSELGELKSARENLNKLTSEQEALTAKKNKNIAPVPVTFSKEDTAKPLVKNMYQTKLILLVGVTLIGLAAYSFIAGAAIATVLKIGLPGLLLSMSALYFYTKRNCDKSLPPVGNMTKSTAAGAIDLPNTDKDEVLYSNQLSSHKGNENFYNSTTIFRT